jgi:uncharacterized Zn-binding protein involved in type VI secretion
MRTAARTSDFHLCPKKEPEAHVGGHIDQGFAMVQIEGQDAARAGDLAKCAAPEPNVIMEGSESVLIGGMPAARQYDKLAHGGHILGGAALVEVGGPTISPPAAAAILANAMEVHRLSSRIEKRKERLDFINRYLGSTGQTPEERFRDNWFKKIATGGDNLPPYADDQGDQISEDIATQEGEFQRKQLKEGIARDERRIRELEAENEHHRRGEPVTHAPPDPDLDKPIVTLHGDNAEPK